MDTAFFLRRWETGLWRSDGDAPALSFEDECTLSHRQLTAISNRIAHGLLAQGVRPGDRVGLLLYNCLEYVPIYLAVMRIGAIAVRLNFRLAEEELSYCLNDAGAEVLIAHAGLAARVEPVLSETPVRKCFALAAEQRSLPAHCRDWSELLRSETSPPPVERPHGDTPAMLMYTSGTTGRPKGAVWTHANTAWFAALQAWHWSYGPDTVAMTTGPMYHVGAVEDLLSGALAAGGHSIVLRSGGFDIERVVRLVEQQGVTDLMLFPFMLYELLHHPRFEEMNLGSLRRIVSGGDPVLPWAIEKLAEAWPQIELVQIYGLTEGSPVAACSTGEESRRRPDAVGRPMPLTEISLRDDEGRPVASGAEGEVWIRSPVAVQEYWNRPDASAETFVDGWVRTGDLGRTTECGLLQISGRKKDMIRSGGENIYPREVEDVLVRCPGVAEAAVIAVPDPKLLEAVCAVVVPESEQQKPDPEALVEWSRQRLASYKKPRHVVFTDSIPRTPSGKIRKHVLRDRYRHLGSDPSPGQMSGSGERQ